MLSSIGKILLVDDRYDDIVKKAVTTLIEKGMPVQFWDGKGNFPETIRNVRVVILDLDLVGLGMRSGPEFYYSAAEALSKIPGPFIVVIMAMDFQEDDPSNLVSFYKTHFKSPLCGFIALKGLSKDEELEDPSRLESLILSSVGENRILNLVLSWEELVDRAKDKAFSDLVAKEIEGTVLALVKSLCKDFGEESAARELANVMMRLISRRICEHRGFDRLNKIIKELNATGLEQTIEYPSEEDLLLYNRLMFYEPGEEEDIWTGDIYRVEGLAKYDSYAIVLTPSCDLVHSRATKVLTCLAFPVCEEYFEDPEYPPNRIDPAIKKKRDKGLGAAEITSSLKERYITRKKSLPEHLYLIWNFRDEKETLGICFNFHDVRSVEKEELKKWKRICRLDSPFVEEIMEKYGKLVSRIGTLEINRSPEQLRDSRETLGR
jgi:hypothetical protein